MISLYSLIWTFISCCPIILLIFVLRRRSDFLSKFGVTFLVILYIFCVVRMFIPIEFPGFQKVICDPYLFSFIMKVYADLGKSGRKTFLVIVFIIWTSGAVLLLIYNLRKWMEAEKALDRWKFEGDGRAEELLKQIDPSCDIEICYSALIKEPFLKGLFHPVIYLPDKKCNDEELLFILMHEYTHWKRKDLWKKLFINLVCILFWWNPLLCLLRRDYSQLIELRCDDTMSRRYSELEALNYLSTLKYMADGRRKKSDRVFADAVGFSLWVDPEPLKQRFRCMLYKKNNRNFQKKMNVVVFTLSLVWLVGSYYFILQPVYDYNPSEQTENVENDVFSNLEDAYLEKKKDGTYIFHYEGYSCEVSKQEVDAGYYSMYPLIEEE